MANALKRRVTDVDIGSTRALLTDRLQTLLLKTYNRVSFRNTWYFRYALQEVMRLFDPNIDP